jgi:hypothetical protein
MTVTSAGCAKTLGFDLMTEPVYAGGFCGSQLEMVLPSRTGSELSHNLGPAFGGTNRYSRAALRG